MTDTHIGMVITICVTFLDVDLVDVVSACGKGSVTVEGSQKSWDRQRKIFCVRKL